MDEVRDEPAAWSVTRQSWIKLLREWPRCNPLGGTALIVVAVVLLTDGLNLRLGLWPLILTAALTGWFGWQGRRRWRWLPLVCVFYIGLHSWHLQQTFFHPLRSLLLAQPDRPQQVAVRARLIPWTEGAELDESQALGDITEIRWGRNTAFSPMQATVRVSLPKGFQLTAPGVYEINGALSLARAPMNPGQFDAENYALRMGWVAEIRAQEVTLHLAERWATRFHLLHWAESSRQWIKEQLARGIENQKEDTAVLLAMALGYSEAAGEDIEDDFRDSGTLHIFAVSGLHVVMLAAVLSFVLRWIGIGQSRAALLLILLVCLYAFITGWRPSAARAALMIAIVLAAPCWNRSASVQNSLGAALLILLAYDTQQLFQAGFQLSFLVLWAIAFLAGPMLNALQPWTSLDPFLPVQVASRWQRISADARAWSASLVCVSLAAWLGSLPLMLGHFQTVTPVGLFANLLLVPISGISIAVSCTSVVCAALGLGVLQIFANLANAILARLMVILAGWFASLPMANFTLDLRFEKPPPPVELSLFHISGGGAASHLRAGQSHWLIDTANVHQWRRIVRPFLRHQGINRLDGLMLTHSDVAHVGAASLAFRYGSPRLHTSVHEPWPLESSLSSIKQLSKRVRVDSIDWHRYQLDAEISIAPSGPVPVYAQVLHPMLNDVNEKADDRDLVLMLHLGPYRVLWLGDAGFITEKKLLERKQPLHCDILVRGQHGADVSGLTELLLAARPRVVISSNDSRYPEQTLPTRLREFCTAQQVPLLDQEICGSVSLSVTRDELKVSTFRTKQELLIKKDNP